ACRCHKQAGRNLKNGSIDMSFVKKGNASKGRSEALAHLKELAEIDRTVSMYRHYPAHHSPDSFTYIMKNLIDSGKFRVFSE
ncbi:MAG: hypothetical protein ACR2PH_13810, partial [Desulfobulbia bacterium]